MPKVCAWSEFPISLRKHQILKFGGKTTENETKIIMCILCFSDYNTCRNTMYKVFKNDVIKNTINADICNTVKKLE